MNEENYTVKHQQGGEGSAAYEFWVIERLGAETPMAYDNEKTANDVAKVLNKHVEDEF